MKKVKYNIFFGFLVILVVSITAWYFVGPSKILSTTAQESMTETMLEAVNKNSETPDKTDVKVVKQRKTYSGFKSGIKDVFNVFSNTPKYKCESVIYLNAGLHSWLNVIIPYELKQKCGSTKLVDKTQNIVEANFYGRNLDSIGIDIDWNMKQTGDIIQLERGSVNSDGEAVFQHKENDIQNLTLNEFIKSWNFDPSGILIDVTEGIKTGSMISTSKGFVFKIDYDFNQKLPDILKIFTAWLKYPIDKLNPKKVQGAIEITTNKYGEITILDLNCYLLSGLNEFGIPIDVDIDISYREVFTY